MRKIEQLWTALKDGGGNSPIVMRGYGPEGHGEIYVTWNIREQQRGIAVRLSKEHRALLNRENELRDISLTVQPISSQGFYLLLQLRNERHQDIFSVLAEDLITGVANVRSEDVLVQALLNRLVQWEALFRKLGTQGLTVEAQRGLYGELYFLHRLIASGMNPLMCVESWVGPTAAVQDFQHEGWATEVKTTAGKNHQKLCISSNRQLDDSGLDELFLFHLSLDARPGGAATLNALVQSVVTDLKPDAAALTLFENRLETGGYLPAHAPLYADIAYSVRSESAFKVYGDFPRITESTTPSGVGDVTYTIIADNCQPWSTTWKAVVKHFTDRRTP